MTTTTSAAARPTGERGSDPLRPLADVLVARARAESHAIRSHAAEEGRARIDAARRDAEEMLASAREDGAEEARALVAAESAQARRQTREVVLAARRAAYEQVRQAAAEAVRELLGDSGERARLVAAVRHRLGPDAVIEDRPDGGVTAETPDGRRIDASVAGLVDEAVSRLDLEGLWAPE